MTNSVGLLPLLAISSQTNMPLYLTGLPNQSRNRCPISATEASLSKPSRYHLSRGPPRLPRRRRKMPQGRDRIGYRVSREPRNCRYASSNTSSLVTVMTQPLTRPISVYSAFMVVFLFVQPGTNLLSNPRSRKGRKLALLARRGRPKGTGG